MVFLSKFVSKEQKSYEGLLKWYGSLKKTSKGLSDTQED